MSSLDCWLQKLRIQDAQSFVKLRQSKNSFDMICNSLHNCDSQAQLNVNEITKFVEEIQKITQLRVNNLITQLHQSFQPKENSNQGSHFQYVCGCGFSCAFASGYRQHYLHTHRFLKYQKHSSHYFTAFGNIAKYDKNIISLIEKEKDKEISQQREQKEEQVVAPIQAPVVQIQEQKKLFQYICGECHSQFPDFKKYSFHMRTHDFIIHPQSSHIIYRKDKKSEPFPVRIESESRQRFYCPCNMSNNFSRQEFVKHVFKWHKGITPKK